MFAALLFWGWESDLIWCGAAAGALLELSRFAKLRWDLEDVDFNRIFSLCVVGGLGVAAYIFTTSEEGGGLSGMFQSGITGLRRASNSGTVAAFSFFRWLPLIFLPFVSAQVYNLRPSVPLTAVSIVLRIRRRRGEQSLAGRFVDSSYPYFIICLFSAGIHTNRATYGYFFGLVVLILWALRTLRSRRFGLKIWAVGLAAVVGVGFLGQFGIWQLNHLVQTWDAELLARWLHSRTDPSQSLTSIGQIGELKLSPRIVIRLEPEQTGIVPNYLRKASYRSYTPFNETWHAGNAQNEFEPMVPEEDTSSWVLLPRKSTNSVVRIACYLEGRSHDENHDPEGVLPLPPGSFRLENLPNGVSVTAVKTNQTGVALATGSGLMIFDARYGPGATFDSPPDSSSTNRFDFMVPTNEVPALRQVIAEMNLTNADATDAEKRLAVRAFFARNFSYSTWQGLDKRATATVTPLTKFLLTSRTGHCEYFATATVLLLRKLGIPTRYAVGYAVHEASGSGYVVRERDAHAWCLVWNRQSRIWEDLDTTPGSWVAIEGRHASFLDTLSDLRSWLVFQFEKFRWRQANLRQYILWTITPVMVVLLYYIFFKHRGRLRADKSRNAKLPVAWPGLDSAFYRLEKALIARGLPRQPQEPLSDWLERALAEPALAPYRAPSRELLRLHYRYRFDPEGLSDDEKKSLVQNVNATLGALAAK
jgi:transglutaminase-like putative cysteine protease